MFWILTDSGVTVSRQVSIPVWFRTRNIGNFQADIVVENCVLVELKAARILDSNHEAQLLNYLRTTSIEVGLLMNFGEKAVFKRFAFDNGRKNIRENPRLSAAILLGDE